MDKNALKIIRKWSKYHQNVTSLEAYRHLTEISEGVFDKKKLGRFSHVRAHIEAYLTNYCGYKKTRKKRENIIILEKDEPTVPEKRIARNYYDRLKLLYHGDLEEGFSI